MINLFIGAVTMSMAESMEAMKEEEDARKRAHQKEKVHPLLGTADAPY